MNKTTHNFEINENVLNNLYLNSLRQRETLQAKEYKTTKCIITSGCTFK